MNIDLDIKANLEAVQESIAGARAVLRARFC